MSGINSDFSKHVVVDTNAMEWTESPAPGVWRKRLDHIGPEESGRVTSLVKFKSGKSFPYHDHPDGEEIFVLKGAFRDDSGVYPTGTWITNPEGFSHSPWVEEDTIIFTKLRQYGGKRPHVVVNTDELEWQQSEGDGLFFKPLYQCEKHFEQVILYKMDPGCTVPLHAHRGGEELFVIEGVLEDEHGRYPAGTWVRSPSGSSHAPFSTQGCIFWSKDGHLEGL